MQRKSRLTLVMMAILLAFGTMGIQPAKPVKAANPLRLSQVYGGSGTVSSTYRYDFFEIYNSGTSPVSLAGMSIQYASATGTGNFGANDTSRTELPDVMLGAGQYYLVQEAGGTNGSLLPTPDWVDATPINASGTAGKVALVTGTVTLGCNGGSAPCPPEQLARIIDLVGFGNANFYEGTAAAPTLSTTTAAIRKGNGCTDTDNNGADFEALLPTPRNTASPAYVCPAGDVPPTVASTLPANSGTAQRTDNITITFSEPVTVVEPWFSISCTTSGTHTAVVTDADPNFTLNPDTDFVVGETCTVTIDHTKVNDDDLDDAIADFMLADYVFNFTIAAGCGDPYTFIYDIQGTGAASPIVGTTVTTEGVVVGDFQVGGKNGYYIQEPNADADPLTSDGLFVYNTTVAVNVGDRVRVTGLITEWATGTGGTLTELTPTSPASSNVLLCSTGNTVAATEVTLPVTAVNDFEKYESMLVTFPQSLIISEYFNFDRYGEIVLTSTRHMTPTALVEPGAPAQAKAAAYLLDRITLDDGRTTQNPDPAIHPNGLIFTMENLFRGGGTVTGVTGILDFYQSLYRVQPTFGATYENANPRTEAPEITEADLKVTSFNVLNYFVTLDDGVNDICGPSGTMECRGADDAEEFARQKAKILSALDIIDADIFGLMEIENDSPISGNDAVADLVAGLNAINGEGTYAYIITGAIGGDAIKQAILYKPASVTPVGEFQILDSSVDPRFIDTANRPALAQAFMDNATGDEFVVAVNHLKSKGSACEGDPDLGDGQGNCNLTRKAAAEALVDWLANPTYFPNIDKALIIGDLNSYDKEDPIDAIKLGADDVADTADDYLDMIFEKQGDDAYGYVFDGQTGYLDHALANQALAENIVDVNFWHINADEPDLIDYDTSFKAPAQDALYAPDAYRSSDHDPVIVTLSFAPLTVTNVDLLQSTDPLTLETTATPVPGSLATGFTMVLDPAVEWYYFDTDTITSSRPLADGSYPFYLEGTTTELFTLVVNGTDYFLRDTYADDGTPLRVQGNFPLGTYTYVGEVMDDLGSTDEVSLTITFVAPLAVTDVGLVQSTDLATWTPVEGNLADSYAMNLDALVEYYYLDAESVTSNRTLGDGSYPFFMTGNPGAEFFAYWAERGVVEGATGWQGLMWQIINGNAPMFFLKVEGTTFTLIDGLQGDPNPLRVNGGYYPGLYTFSGAVEDAFGFEDELDVSILFNDVPVAEDQAVTTPEDTPVDVTLTAVDILGDPLEFTIVDQPMYGSVTLVGTTATYTPDLNFNGEDSFTFIANDGTIDSNLAVVTITVTSVNDAPVAVEDAYTVAEDGQKVVAAPGVLGNDTDPDGDMLTAVLVGTPETAHGYIALAQDGSFMYTPDANFHGEDSFIYKAFDGTAYSEETTVTITVTSINDAPVAVEDAYTTDEDTVLTVLVIDGVLANDTDVDGDTLTAVLVSDVSNGTLALADDGSFVYTPNANYFGSDSFTYKASDGTLESEPVTVTITVGLVNDWVVANDDEYETMAGVTLEIAAPGVLVNDVLLDPNETVTLEVLVQPAGGTVTLNNDGSFTYVPNAGFFGVDTFEYQLNSTVLLNGEFSDTAIVTIKVTPKQIFLPLILR